MGLPMYKEPGESSPQRAVAKVERAAASSRSAIRRERTVRDSETFRRSGERNENQVPSGRTTDLLPQARPRTRVRIRRDNGTEDESRSTGGRGWGSMIEAARRGDEEAFHNALRLQVDEELLRDSTQYQRPSHRMRLPRSPRTSALRFEVAPAPRSSASPERAAEEQALLARPYMPSPPYSFSDNTATGLRPRGTERPLSILPAEPTLSFAPARGVHRDNEERESATRGSAPRHYTPPGEPSWTSSYPPLRRVSHFSPRPESNLLNLSGYGGLGDRRRSVSSSSDAEQDTWETLLTTMEPDTQLPSTDSSFTSASASQSTIRPQNAYRSQNTSFASATTATERFLSRPTSPTWPHPRTAEYREMDLEIRSAQYDCLSEESRGSMRIMLDIIENAQQFRISNPVGDVAQFLRPRSDESPILARRRQQAHENLTVAESRLQADENSILFNHFTTLREMDGLRASNNARPRRMANTHIPSWQRAHQHTTDNHNGSNNSGNDRQPRVAHDLLRIIEHQTQQIAQDMQGSETGPASRPEQQQSRAQTPDSTTITEEMENVQRVIQRVARREGFTAGYWAGAGTGGSLG